MNYTSSSTNTILSYSTGTVIPVTPYYLQKGISYIPLEPIIYRLNMPFKSNLEITPRSIVDYSKQKDDGFNSYINDAKKRYKEINNGAVFDITYAVSFLSVLKTVCDNLLLEPYIIFNKFATKVQLSINGKKFVLDYDHEYPNTVFILSSRDDTLIVRESTLNELEETLRSF